jgi:MFS transporter, PPP family, 3-phenylpropionic acid transporter
MSESPPVPADGARIDRNVRALYAVGGVATAAILPFFSLLLRDRGLQADQVGLVLAAWSLAGVVTAPIWSHYADTRFGTVRTLVVASIAAACAALGLAAVGSIAVAILALVVLLGVAQSPITALADALALTTLGVERESRYGTIRLWTSVGWGVAVIAFGAWFEHSGLNVLLPVYAAGALAYAAVASTFPRTSGASATHGSRLGALGEVLHSSGALRRFLVGLLLVGMATQAAWTFVPLRIADRGGGPFLIGLAAGIAAFIEIPFFAASGRLAARFGQRALFVAGVGVYIAMMLAFAAVSNPEVVAFIRAGSGVGFGLVYASLVVIAGTLTPSHLRNTGQAVIQTINWGIAPVIGAAMGGLIYRHLGAPTLFLIAAASASVGAFVAWRALADERFASSAARARSATGDARRQGATG